MEPRGIFSNLSPLDHRYSLSDPDLFNRLSACLSEEATVRSCLRVELALLKTILSRLLPGSGSAKRDALLDGAAAGISPEEVYDEEEKTHHNVRALVNVLKRHLPADVRPYVHLGATSADILDTASALRYRDAIRTVILPLLLDLEEELVRQGARGGRYAADRPHARAARSPDHLRLRHGRVRGPARKEHPEARAEGW